MIADLKPYPAYRDSGSFWLGTVPSHWEVQNLRTLIRSYNERNRPDLPLLSVAREKGVFVRSLTDAGENHNVIPEDLSNYKVARAGNLVINKMKAWQGSMGIAPCDGIVSPAYFVFNFTIANRSFGQALLRSKPYVAHFGQASDGVRVGQWDLTIRGMRQIPILLPPPDEQAAIMRVLGWANGQLEKAIRAKRKVITLLNEQKLVIIHRAVTRGIEPSVPLKPSGISWIGAMPLHWTVVTVGSVLSLIQTGPFGSQLHSHEYVAGGIPVINPSHMENGRIVASREIAIGENKLCELSRHKLYAGDIIAARRGEIGRCALVTSVEVGWICGTGSVLLRCKSSMVLPVYFQRLFSSQGISDELNLSSIGATMPNLNSGMIARLRIPLPPVDEQERIVRYIECQNKVCDTAISRFEREIELLREYRTRLVADVVTGKLDVREAAAKLPDELQTLEFEDDLAALEEDVDSTL